MPSESLSSITTLLTEPKFSDKINPKTIAYLMLAVGCLGVFIVLVWQGLTSHGAPDPLAPQISRTASVMNTGILVFREGLEAVLVLAAIAAGLVRREKSYWKPIALGAALSFLASVATWFAMVGVISSVNASALHIQAVTGLIAIFVLLVIMNWFFHKIYWGGWIAHHHQRIKEVTKSGINAERAIFRGLLLVGFTSVYREGFEVDLFLQSIRLRAGMGVVKEGVAIGLILTVIVGIATFVLHYRLGYKRLLIVTGALLCLVLVVMVGESAQELQDAGWITATSIPLAIPEWMGTWFAVFPTIESLLSQVVAATLVVGSYVVARRGYSLI